MSRVEGAKPRKAPLLTRQERIALVVAFILALGYAGWHVFLRGPKGADLGRDIAIGGEGLIFVQVEGAVAHPGMVRVPVGSRVSDAIGAAGGLLPEADRGKVEMEAIVREGDKIVVPFQKEGASPSSDASASGGSFLIDINKASQEELEKLPGIGKVLAARIIEYRNVHGRFRSVEELLNIRGIGEKTLEKIRPYITVGE